MENQPKELLTLLAISMPSKERMDRVPQLWNAPNRVCWQVAQILEKSGDDMAQFWAAALTNLYEDAFQTSYRGDDPFIDTVDTFAKISDALIGLDQSGELTEALLMNALEEMTRVAQTNADGSF